MISWFSSSVSAFIPVHLRFHSLWVLGVPCGKFSVHNLDAWVKNPPYVREEKGTFYFSTRCTY
jgi:hypothetical protein